MTLTNRIFCRRFVLHASEHPDFFWTNINFIRLNFSRIMKLRKLLSSSALIRAPDEQHITVSNKRDVLNTDIIIFKIIINHLCLWHSWTMQNEQWTLKNDSTKTRHLVPVIWRHCLNSKTKHAGNNENNVGNDEHTSARSFKTMKHCPSHKEV